MCALRNQIMQVRYGYGLLSILGIGGTGTGRSGKFSKGAGAGTGRSE